MTEAYVVGVGMHRVGKYPEKSLPSLARDAIWAAISDAELDPRQIGVAYLANCYHGFFTGQHDAIAPIVFGRAGLSGMPMIHVEGGGAAGSVAFHDAVLAVKSEQYDIALAVGAEKLYVPGNPAISISAIATSGELGIATEMGLTWVGEFTMNARKIMERYGWTARDFAAVASKNRWHASMNHDAELQSEISEDEVLNARMVAYPITRPMCTGAATDGAAAVLITNKEVAGKIGNGKHPRVAGIGALSTPYLSNRAADSRPGMISMDGASRAFEAAYAKSGFGPTDLDLVQVHDSVAPEELLAYQVIGLAEPGAEGDLVRSGATRIGGRIPVNTDGGLIARGHPIAASGVAQVVETVRQLRGTAGRRQVISTAGKLPRVGAIQNAGAQGGPSGGVGFAVAFLLEGQL